MQAHDDFQQLLKRVMAGDAVAQDEFCKRFEVQLRRMLAASFVARGAVGHSDIAQSTFRRFFQELQAEKLTVSQPHEVIATLIRYARNLSVDTIRKRSVREEHREKLRLYFLNRGSTETIEDKVERAELVSALNELLENSLNDQERQIVDLRVNAGMSFQQIGDALGMSANLAKNKFHHVIAELRIRLADK